MARQKAALEEDYAELGADLVACRTNLTTTTDSLLPASIYFFHLTRARPAARAGEFIGLGGAGAAT